MINLKGKLGKQFPYNNIKDNKIIKSKFYKRNAKPYTKNYETLLKGIFKYLHKQKSTSVH